MSRTRKTKQIVHADIVKRFGVRLRELRMKRGLSQGGLAKRAGTHVTYVSKMERGRSAPGLDLLERISMGLNVNIYDLIATEQADLLPVLRQQTERRFASIMKKADAATLAYLNPLLALIDEKLSRRKP